MYSKSNDSLGWLMQIKTALIKTGFFEDSMPCHLASGLGAGFFAVVCGSPVDVVKSRLMGTPQSSIYIMLRCDYNPAHRDQHHISEACALWVMYVLIRTQHAEVLFAKAHTLMASCLTLACNMDGLA